VVAQKKTPMAKAKDTINKTLIKAANVLKNPSVNRAANITGLPEFIKL
jgi:hypothetical protein